MKCRCPKCGTWTDATEHSITENARDAYYQAASTGERIGKVIGSPFGKLGETVGRKVGDTLGSMAGLGTSVLGGIFGDKYQFKCPNCGEEWGLNNKTEENHKYELEQEQVQAQALEDLSDSVVDDVDRLHDLWNDDIDKDAIKSLIDDMERKVDSLPNDYLRYIEYSTIAVANYLIDENRKACVAIEKAIASYPAQNGHCIRGLIKYENMAKDTPTIKVYDVLKDMKYVLDKGREENDYFQEEVLFDTWEDAINDYVNDFLTIPPSQRRFVCLRDSWDVITDEIKVLPIDRIPVGMHFPTPGHPKADVLYVVHPLRSDTYYPADNIDFELFRDQMKEFTSIMVSLGAKYLKYYDMQDSSRDESHSAAREIGGKVKVKAVEVSGDYQSEKENAKYSHFRQELEEESEFLPGQPPALPDESLLVWYPTRSDWQEKVENRLKGIRFRDKFRVSTSFEESISGKERLAVETEMKILLNSASVKYNSDLSYTLKRTEDRIWSIEVEFYPLQTYNQQSESTPQDGQNNLVENDKPDEESGLKTLLKKIFN